ncbi:hypothetical protein FA15DRAFT_698379 [Coprinopsis marcescibilis]|uniref:Mucoidy inhibitor A n=1 Tax=Coprinopsis marcescibilis TaxID=230819 RepID=A0A5C3KC49_COPMA|nr:hypothetical protein FA15DRAFT_698379 [Coprinopsis marcescibilis]
MAESNPPAFEPHVVDLESIEDSKILSVSVYSGRAEVTRLFKFTVKAGQNQVNISGLPNVLDQNTLRVNGRGAGTIQEVSTSYITPEAGVKTSAKLKELLREKEVLDQRAHRAQKTLAALDKYIGTLVANSTPSASLKDVLVDYNSNAEGIQAETLVIDDKQTEVDEAVRAEKLALEGKKRDSRLNVRASIGVFADSAGEIELSLVYAVYSASWTARYDIRVNTQVKQTTVQLIYKGAITQDTGEDWKDVPLTLETATPTFDNQVPELDPWTLSVETPNYVTFKSSRSSAFLSAPPPTVRMMAMAAPAPSAAPIPRPEMAVRSVEIASKGSVSSTFSVPGKMSIPSDNSAHNVTIVQLTLDAIMSWVSVPKKDTKVNLNAKIKNSSEFLLLAGPASVYVDGSFISRSSVPAVSPDESFDCPLGLDPAVKVVYHPQTKKLSKTGLINKSDVYLFTQRITVHNSKTIDIDNVKVIDHIPVSEDAAIVVKLISPALQLPTTESGGSVRAGKSDVSSTVVRIPSPVKVASGITAKWDDGGEDEENIDVTSLGKNGKINFVCALPAQGKTNLTLQWEVTAPAKTKISGI